MSAVTIPRLYIWVPGTAEEIAAGRKGWLPALIVGTQWDVKQWRLQYRARHICTAFIKWGLDAT
jgi:hypothetical protein